MKNISALNGKLLGLAAISAFAAISQGQPPSIRVNGQQVQFDMATPHMMGGQLIVPIRKVVEQAGGNVDWSSASKTVLAQKGETQLQIQVPTEVAKVNGTETAVNGPIHIMKGCTMVPVRFLADSLGASLRYNAANNEVDIQTIETPQTPTAPTTPPDTTPNNPINPPDTTTTPTTPTTPPDTNVPTTVPTTPPDTNVPTTTTNPPPDMAVQPVGSAMKATLDTELSSNGSYVGQPFTATVQNNSGDTEAYGIPEGTKVRGHVTFVQAMQDGMPGILGITFDSLVLDDGRAISITASPIDAESDIETSENGRWMATPSGQSKYNLKFVGDGSASGVLVPLMTDQSSVSVDDLNQAMPNRGESYNVDLAEGTTLGIRLDHEAVIRAYQD